MRRVFVVSCGRFYDMAGMTSSRPVTGNRLCATFALVLLDQSMPTMSGGEVLQRLRSLTPDLPVIIFTGQGVRLDQFPCATAVLSKPVKQHELLSVVAQGLNPALLDPE